MLTRSCVRGWAAGAGGRAARDGHAGLWRAQGPHPGHDCRAGRSRLEPVLQVRET